MSFSSVDRSLEPARLIASLDASARGLAGMKHYILATHARAGQGPVLDLGCGAGHDLALLGSAGLAAIGVDPSAVMLATCRSRRITPPIVQATGEALPFRDDSMAACRIERVLQHVRAPDRVIHEVARCVRAGAVVTVFEPDWTSLRIASDILDPDARWLPGLASPDAGRMAALLLEDAGFDVMDIVSERSFTRALRAHDLILPLESTTARAVEAGRVPAGAAAAWLDEQRRRDEEGRFLAEYTKVLVVAVRRALGGTSVLPGP